MARLDDMHIIHTLVATTDNLAVDRYIFYYETYATNLTSLLPWMYT